MLRRFKGGATITCDVPGCPRTFRSFSRAALVRGQATVDGWTFEKIPPIASSKVDRCQEHTAEAKSRASELEAPTTAGPVKPTRSAPALASTPATPVELVAVPPVAPPIAAAPTLCPIPVFVDDGWPAGQCRLERGHADACRVMSADRDSIVAAAGVDVRGLPSDISADEGRRGEIEKPVSRDSGSLTTETTSPVSGQLASPPDASAEKVGDDRLSTAEAAPARKPRAPRVATEIKPRKERARLEMPGTLAIVVEILREAATPLSAREIVARAGERLVGKSKSKTPHTVVSRDLALDVKRRGEASIFVRTSPGRFTLRDLLTNTMNTSTTNEKSEAA